MKKFSFNNYFTKRKVLEFLDKKGFYLVLLLCIGIITITAYTVTKRNLATYMDDTQFDQLSQTNTKTDQKANPSKIQTDKASVNKVDDKAATAAKKPGSVQNQQAVSTTALAAKPAVQSKNTVSLAFPVTGGVSQDFAKSYLVYSKTLEQWTTHEGLDIAVDRGTPVKAAADGVIADVFNDAKYGITIVIDHGNGIKTRYSNLSTDTMVKKGSKVKKGDVISGVGSTAIFESGEPAHVHFEVLQDGLSVNPKNFIK